MPYRPVLVLSLSGDTATVMDCAVKRTVDARRLGPDFTGNPVRAHAWAYLHGKPRSRLVGPRDAPPKPEKHRDWTDQEPTASPPVLVNLEAKRAIADRNFLLAAQKARAARLAREAAQVPVAPPLPQNATTPVLAAPPEAVPVVAKAVPVPVQPAPGPRPVWAEGMDERLYRALLPEPDRSLYFSRSRDVMATRVRWRVWSRLRQEGMSLQEIGDFTGHDHTSVMASLQSGSVLNTLENDAAMRKLVAEAIDKIRDLFTVGNCIISRRDDYVQARTDLYKSLWPLCRSFSVIARLCGVRHNTVLTALRRCGAVGTGECVRGTCRKSVPDLQEPAGGDTLRADSEVSR